MELSITDAISSGGCGDVYLVHDTRGNEFAVKVLKENNIKGISDIMEISIMNTYKHENLANSFYTCIRDDQIFMFQEKAISDLSDYVRGNHVTDRTLKKWSYQILMGLHFLHNENIIHCDIKPANVLVYRDGNVKLTDFSLSIKMVANDQRYHHKKGTPLYIAPELIEGNWGIYSDIWAFGVTLYEIYDLEHDKLIVLAEDHDEFLRDENIPDGIEGSPYEFLRFNEIPDELHPLSDIKNLKPIQEEHNLGRAMIMTHAKRFGRKYGYKDGTFPPGEEDAEMEKLKDPEDGGFFKYAEEMPIPMLDAPLDSAVYQNFQQTSIDFHKVGGSTEHERGTVERRKTAFEAGQISKEAGIRKEDRKSLTEDFAAGVGAKLLQSFQANLTIEQAVEIAGQAGMQWQNISRENITGQFTVGVEIGSAAPAIPEFERQDFSYEKRR